MVADLGHDLDLEFKKTKPNFLSKFRRLICLSEIVRTRPKSIFVSV